MATPRSGHTNQILFCLLFHGNKSMTSSCSCHKLDHVAHGTLEKQGNRSVSLYLCTLSMDTIKKLQKKRGEKNCICDQTWWRQGVQPTPQILLSSGTADGGETLADCPACNQSFVEYTFVVESADVGRQFDCQADQVLTANATLHIIYQFICWGSLLDFWTKRHFSARVCLIHYFQYLLPSRIKTRFQNQFLRQFLSRETIFQKNHQPQSG